MIYSNNYSKYIENLKLEKSKKAFRELVESTQEIKTEVVSFDENYTKKESTSVKSAYDTVSNKKSKKLVFEDDYSRSNSQKIKNQDIINNSQDYSNLSTDVEATSAEKKENKISNVEEASSYNFSREVSFETVDSKKENKNISEITIENKKDSNEAEFEIIGSTKSGSEIILENQNDTKLLNDISVKDDNSKKELSDISTKELPSAKTKEELIFLVKQEKKARKLMLEREISSSKEGGEFDYLVAIPKKNELTNLNRQYSYFTNSLVGNITGTISSIAEGDNFYDVANVIIGGVNTKKYEEMEYKINARAFDYYPFGSYSEINSKQSGAITDAFNAVTNPSNWETPGKFIVSSLKVATDIVDMINLVGPSRNIYRSTTANNLRWDLNLPDKNGKSALEGEKERDNIPDISYKSHGGHIGYDFVPEGKDAKDEEIKKFIIDGKEIDGSDDDYAVEDLTYLYDNYYGKEQKEKTKEVNGKYIDVTWDTEEETEDFSEIPGEKNALIADSTKTEVKNNITYVYATDNTVDIENNIKSQTNDSDGNLTDDSKKDDTPDISYKSHGGHTGYDFDLEGKNAKDDSLETAFEFDENNIGVNLADDIKGGKNAADPSKTETRNGVKYYGLNTVDIESNIINQKFAYITSNSTDSDRWFDYPSSLGEIYVIPPYNELSSFDSNNPNNKVDIAFRIPLQNNLQFEQISRPAAYNALSFFGRIGDVQQYYKTGSLDLISITTKYFVDSNDTSSDVFTMEGLQDIEMMYRSLVLPVEISANYFGDTGDNSRYYYFTRPPIVNIVLNKDGLDESLAPTVKTIPASEIGNVYNNLFTDIYSSYNNSYDENGVLSNSELTHKTFYKNFVVTNVTIDKNDNEYNYYVVHDPTNNTGKIYDKMGFTVTLTLLEIDENYLGSVPSFNNYYNTVNARNKYIITGQKNVQ